MRDVYVLRTDEGRILCVADDFDRASMEMHRYTHLEQSEMLIENHDLLERGD